MKKLLQLLSLTSALACTAVFASEPSRQDDAPAAPAKKDGDKKCPNCPDEKPKALIQFSINLEDAPAAPAKKEGDKKCPNCPDEKPKAEDAPAAPAKKDGDKKCPCPDEKPKA